MPFLPLDLDGKKKVPRVAKACGVSPGDILWGLAEMWEHVWNTKSDMLGVLVLDGCFGPSDLIRAALVEFGFLEAMDGRWRVRGAARFLKVAASRSEGAKLTNAKRWGATEEQPETSLPVAPAVAERSLPVALHPTPNTQHPPTSKKEEGNPPPRTAGATVSAPDTPPEQWTGEDFWRWAQTVRIGGGLLAEKWPKKPLGSWWAACLMTEGVTPRALKEGFYKFGASKHWEAADPPYPFSAFMAEWEKFTRPEARHGSAA